MSLAEQAELVTTLKLRDQMSAGLRKTSTGVSALDKRVTGLKNNFSRTGQAMGNLSRNLKLGLVGLVGVGGLAIKWAADFEEQLDTINTVAKASPQALADIGDGIKKLARDTGTSTDELAAAYYDLVSAGVAAADAQTVLTEANELAIGGLSTTGEAVDLLTTAINAYGKDASEAARIADGFAQSIAAGKVTAAELAASFARVAPQAAALGIEIEELQAGYSVMTAAGVKAAETSTYMASAITALQRKTAPMEVLQKKMNVDFKELARERGLAVAYQILAKGADKYGFELIDVLGRQEAVAFALLTGGRNARGYAKALQDIKRSHDGEGVAAGQAAERQKGFNRTVARLKETVKTTFIDGSVAFLPVLKKVTDRIASFVSNNRAKLATMGRGLAAAIDKLINPQFRTRQDEGATVVERIESPLDKLAGYVGTINWSAVGEGLKIAGQGVVAAVNAFNSMDPEIQKGLIAFFTANKLLAGAPAAAIRDFAGIVLSSLKTITAANVTVIGKTVTGPGGGGGTPLGPPSPTTPGETPPKGTQPGVVLPGIGAIAFFDTGEAMRLWEQANAYLHRTADNTEQPKPGFDESGRRQFGGPGGRRGLGKGLGESATIWRELPTKFGDQVERNVKPPIESVGKAVQSAKVAEIREQHTATQRAVAAAKQAADRTQNQAVLTREQNMRSAAATKSILSGLREAAQNGVVETAGAKERLGSVIRGILGVEGAVNRKDLSVTTNVNTTLQVSAVTIARQVDRVVARNRQVAE